MKCESVREKDKLDLILASEGFGGSHPQLFFMKSNEEISEQLYRENKLTEDPMYCDFCNP